MQVTHLGESQTPAISRGEEPEGATPGKNFCLADIIDDTYYLECEGTYVVEIYVEIITALWG